MAWAIRSACWFSFGLYLLGNAFSRYLHPSTDPFANGLTNVMSGVVGALLVYGAYNTYRGRNLAGPADPNAASPRTMMRFWLLGATFLVLSMFWPLVWQWSLNLRLLGRIVLLAYSLFEAREEYRESRRQSIPVETVGGSVDLKIMGAFVVAFGVAVLGFGLWAARSEWSKVSQWPRTAGVLVDKKISPVGARLIFEYQVAGGQSAGRVDRLGQEEELRTFLEPYRVGNSYPIGYNPQDASDVEFHLGYQRDLFRGPTAIVIFGALFAAAGLWLGAPWQKEPER
jgi:hypothetical protein